MSVKLFVGNLNFDASEDDVRDLFESLGTIEDIFVAHDRYTGRPRGFAFVTMSESSAAEEAIRKLDGQDFMGRPLRVNEAQPKEERPRFDRPRGGGGGRNFRGGGGSRRGDRRQSSERDGF